MAFILIAIGVLGLAWMTGSLFGAVASSATAPSSTPTPALAQQAQDAEDDFALGSEPAGRDDRRNQLLELQRQERERIDLEDEQHARESERARQEQEDEEESERLAERYSWEASE